MGYRRPTLSPSGCPSLFPHRRKEDRKRDGKTPRMSNPDPSPGTRFQRGNRANPGGRKKDDPAKVDLVAEMRRQLALVDPETRITKAEELIAALLEAGCDGDIRAIQEVLARIHGRIEPRMAVARFEEHIQARAMAAEQAELERIREEKSIVEDAAIVAALMREGLAQEQAEEFVAELKELGMAAKMKNWTITDELKNRALGWPARPRVSAARKEEIIHELLCRYGLAELDVTPESQRAQPPPEPSPPPEPDRSEPESDRPEPATPVGGPPPAHPCRGPAPRPEPVRLAPPPPPPLPPLPDPSCFVRMGDMCIFLPEE